VRSNSKQNYGITNQTNLKQSKSANQAVNQVSNKEAKVYKTAYNQMRSKPSGHTNQSKMEGKAKETYCQSKPSTQVNHISK
jgi:hypothetical protein